MKIYSVLIIITFALVFFMTCNPEEVAQLDTTPYEINYAGFPNPDLPADNPLTKAGVQLGRMLFYEKAMSKNGTQACADCHRQSDSFSDSLKFSIGVEKLPGKDRLCLFLILPGITTGCFGMDALQLFVIRH